MKKYKNKIFFISLCIILFIIFFGGEKIKLVSVEDYDINIGVGDGIEKKGEGNIEYRVSVNPNIYKEARTLEEVSTESVVYIGKGSTIGKTREDRQRKTGKQFFLGLSKLYLLDEEYAQYGIRMVIDIIFKNPIINDNAFLAVCKGKNEQYFNYNTPGYENASEYMSDMIKNLSNYNFFKEDYTLKDAILSMDAEGKNIICPYIKMEEDGFKFDGMAVFKRDKLGAVLDMDDTKVMNMLRENKVKGILTIQKNSKEYINFEAKSKRKIKCNKTGDKYAFTIDLNINGDIRNNKLYKNITEKVDVTKKFEEDMSKNVEEMCYRFLYKMKNQYKLDCLQLGWVAAAKYGRDTGVDWNEVICNSDIKVNVKVRVNRFGRGEY